MRFEKSKENLDAHLYVLDVFRLVSAIIIFMFHSMARQYHYGILDPFIGQGAIFMTAFFELSGFSLYYGYYRRAEHLNIYQFYIKRMAGIYPVYLVIAIWYFLFSPSLSIKRKIFIMPFEMSLLQSTIDGTFGTLHNGGTWFISCIAFCYFLFPFLIMPIKKLKKNAAIIIAVVLVLISGYGPMVAYVMKYSNVYSNPIYRLLEFLIGMIAAKLFIEQGQKNDRGGAGKYCIAEMLALIAGVYILSLKSRWGFRECTFMTAPLFAMLLYHGAIFEKQWNQRLRWTGGRLWRYAITITYEFWIAQFWVWDIVQKIYVKIPVLETNLGKIITAFAVCSGLAVLLHEGFTKPGSKFILRCGAREGKSDELC